MRLGAVCTILLILGTASVARAQDKTAARKAYSEGSRYYNLSQFVRRSKPSSAPTGTTRSRCSSTTSRSASRAQAQDRGDRVLSQLPAKAPTRPQSRRGRALVGEWRRRSARRRRSPGRRPRHLAETKPDGHPGGASAPPATTTSEQSADQRGAADEGEAIVEGAVGVGRRRRRGGGRAGVAIGVGVGVAESSPGIRRRRRRAEGELMRALAILAVADPRDPRSRRLRPKIRVQAWHGAAQRRDPGGTDRIERRRLHRRRGIDAADGDVAVEQRPTAPSSSTSRITRRVAGQRRRHGARRSAASSAPRRQRRRRSPTAATASADGRRRRRRRRRRSRRQRRRRQQRPRGRRLQQTADCSTGEACDTTSGTLHQRVQRQPAVQRRLLRRNDLRLRQRARQVWHQRRLVRGVPGPGVPGRRLRFSPATPPIPATAAVATASAVSPAPPRMRARRSDLR